MKSIRVVSQLFCSASLVSLAAVAIASGWMEYESKHYGFSMLVPAGTSTKETEWAGGWGGLTAVHEGVKLFGLAKLGARESDDEIEKFAVQTIGIPASASSEASAPAEVTTPTRNPKARAASAE